MDARRQGEAGNASRTCFFFFCSLPNACLRVYWKKQQQQQQLCFFGMKR